MLVLLAGTWMPAFAAEPEVIVEIERPEIYEGESVLYRVTLNHVENPSPPELKGFDNFKITSLGEESLNSTSITIINGVRRETIRRGRQYNYRLTPKKDGVLRIPAPTARVGNQVLKGRALTLRVIAPEDQDAVLLEITADRTSVYPMQPFTVTLNVAVKELPAPHAARSPLGVQSSPPVLIVPWLSDNELPEGLEPKTDWRRLLQSLVSRRGTGFQINNIGQSSIFSLFEQETTAFEPKPRRTRRADKAGKQVGYWEYAFPRTFIPRKVGRYEFGPVTLKGTFASGVEADRLLGERVYAVAKSIPVTVKNVPDEGRPGSFIGAVGVFKFASELTPTQARVGDPMTLTLVLSGQGTLEDAFAPDLTRIPEIAANFKTYDPTQETKGNSRRFTYSLRPLRAGIKMFPAVPVSFFDVKRERYVTVTSKPIPVRIEKAEQFSDDQIVSVPNAAPSGSATLEESQGGIFANDSDWKSLRNENVHAGRWAVAWFGMIGGYLLATVVIGHVGRLHADPALVRRRGAAARARSAMKQALAELHLSQDHTACKGLRSAVIGLIADVTDTPEEGVTPRDARERLNDVGAPEELAEATCQFLERCDAGRYSSAGGDVASLGSGAKRLLENLLDCFRSRRLLR